MRAYHMPCNYISSVCVFSAYLDSIGARPSGTQISAEARDGVWVSGFLGPFHHFNGSYEWGFYACENARSLRYMRYLPFYGDVVLTWEDYPQYYSIEDGRSNCATLHDPNCSTPRRCGSLFILTAPTALQKLLSNVILNLVVNTNPHRRTVVMSITFCSSRTFLPSRPSHPCRTSHPSATFHPSTTFHLSRTFHMLRT